MGVRLATVANGRSLTAQKAEGGAAAGGVVRILHVITRWLRGGAEEKTFREIEGLRREHDFTLVSGPEVDPIAVARLAKLGVEHRTVPDLVHLRPHRWGLAVRQLKTLTSEGWDVVHTHSTEAGVLARHAAHRSGVTRIVHTIHGPEFSSEHPLPFRLMVLAAQRRLAPVTRRYFSNADALTRAYLAAGIGNPGQYTTIRSGVDIDALAKVDPRRSRGAPALLAAGRLVGAKGFEDLIDALPLIRARHPGVVLSLAGDGPLREALVERARRNGVEQNLDILGHVEDLPARIAGSDIFVHASYREGTPRVVTEALAVGRSVVATRIDGVPEQVLDGVNGFLIPVRAPSAIAAAVERIADSPALRAQMERAARERAQEFSLSRMIARTREEYAALA